jgi:hypothetical protein
MKHSDEYRLASEWLVLLHDCHTRHNMAHLLPTGWQVECMPSVEAIWP